MAAPGRYADLQKNQDRELLEAIEYMHAKQNRFLATTERKRKLMNGAADEIQEKFLSGCLGLEEKISEVEYELHEPSEEMRTVAVKRRKAEEELRASPRLFWVGVQFRGPEALKMKLENWRCPMELGALGGSQK